MRLRFTTFTLIAISLAVLAGCKKNEPEQSQVVPGEDLFDCQGNKYATVKIGDQTWMAENLRCTKYDTQSEGYGLELLEKASGTGEKKPICFDARDKMQNDKYAVNLTDEIRAKLGFQYSWGAAVGLADYSTQKSVFALKRQGICPNGWHLPTQEEWETFSSTVKTGSSSRECERIKAKAGWYENGNGSDIYGFAALPAGICHSIVPSASSMSYIGYQTSFWSATLEIVDKNEDDPKKDPEYVVRGARYVYLNYVSFNTSMNTENQLFTTMSVRCVKN